MLQNLIRFGILGKMSLVIFIYVTRHFFFQTQYYLSIMSDEEQESDTGSDRYWSHTGNSDNSVSDSDYEPEDGEDISRSEAVDQLARVPGLTFCPVHKPGQMVEVCKTCRTVLALVRPAVAKQLLIPGKTSSAVHRYATRSDEQEPSLFLPGNIVDLAENVFTSGTYKSKTHWQELVKKFLTLPVIQHDRLTKDLELEDMFKTHQSDKRFAHVFKYKKELGNALKMLRIAQRVIFSNINSVDMLITKLREQAETVGVAFNENQPSRANKSVPNNLLDSLSVENMTAVFSLPAITDFFEGVSVDDVPQEVMDRLKRNVVVIEDELKDYRNSCVDQFSSMFSAVAKEANDLDDGFAFYVDLYGHVDATIRYGCLAFAI